MAQKKLNPSSEKLLQELDFASELAELEDQHLNQIQGLLLRFIEVKDSVEELLSEYGGTDQSQNDLLSKLLKRIRLVDRQIGLGLERSEVLPICSLDQIPDAMVHHVVGVEERADLQRETIIGEKVRGYRHIGAILRRPEVVVGKPPNL